MKSWQDKETVKKGNIGEEIVENYLEKRGYTIYKPVTENAHGFDRLVSMRKANFVICEVKTKARRNKYPDTGIDLRHYYSYLEISQKHNMPVYIYFVDEMLKQIYGGKLSDMDTSHLYEYNSKRYEYPLIQGRIIYFFQPIMQVIHHLTDEEVIKLKEYSTRNHDYNPEV